MIAVRFHKQAPARQLGCPDSFGVVPSQGAGAVDDRSSSPRDCANRAAPGRWIAGVAVIVANQDYGRKLGAQIVRGPFRLTVQDGREGNPPGGSRAQ